MAPRTASVAIEPYVVESVASPAATRKLFGIDDARAKKIDAWLAEAIAEVKGEAKGAGPKKPPRPRASTKKRSSKRGG